jgi:hypothetical protein
MNGVEVAHYYSNLDAALEAQVLAKIATLRKLQIENIVDASIIGGFILRRRQAIQCQPNRLQVLKKRVISV